MKATTPTTTMSLSFRPITPSDLPTCIDIETASYPPDEAASPEGLTYRQTNAGAYFRCVCSTTRSKEKGEEDNGEEMLGFVCATRCAAFTHESMSTHDPHGELLAIHSVVVKQDHRRQGIATKMLKAYVRHVEEQEARKPSGLSKMVLLAKAHLLGFYVNCGFTVTRPSPIVHGQELWYELERVLPYRMEQSKCFVVDAFGNPNQRGTGNPAAVVLLERPPKWDDPACRSWMQTIAAEFNLSETAFCWPIISTSTSTPGSTFGIRYFTPTTEVPLCGHATLATASILYQTERVPIHQPVSLQASHDLLQARTVDGDSTHIAMTFPSYPARSLVEHDKMGARQMLQKAFGITSDDIVWMGVSPGIGDLLVQVTSPDLLNSLTNIEYDAMKEWDGYSRGIILSSLADQENDSFDFVSRFFAPKAGVPEDPVTGSAHTVLVPYYAGKMDKSSHLFRAQQWSVRGGWLTCQLLGDIDRVEISGRAVTTLRGNLQ